MAKKKKKNKNKYEGVNIPDIETVVWEDHNSVDAWQDPDTYQPAPIVVISTGFVVYEDDDIISLANSYNENDGYCCIINILKCCIV